MSRRGPEHGTRNMYSNYGCRCDPCKLAGSSYHSERRSRGLPDPDDPKHGTMMGYSKYACRCEDCRNASKSYRLQRKYGITLEEYWELLKSQDFKCASCGDFASDLSDSWPRFPVDHDHDTGEVRGILCPHCNIAFGHLKEDVERVQKLLHYIQRKRGNN